MFYDFKDESGNDVSLILTWQQYEAAKIGNDTILHEGRSLTRVYQARSMAADSRFKPIISESMGGHPSQRDEMMAEAKRLGVPTEFTADACPILTSQAHKRAYMKAMGYRENNAYY